MGIITNETLKSKIESALSERLEPELPVEIAISGVFERDIDLLLIEEFVASPAFLEWFLDRVGVKLPVELLDAKHSVMTPNGESDLELSLKHENSSNAKILIENKVDACFQETQPERYTARAALYRDSGNWNPVITVLVAPAAYSGSSQTCGFDRRVSYEEILAWFQRDQPCSGRTLYKLKLLNQALERSRSGYQRQKWDEPRFFDEAEQRLSTAYLQAVTSLYEWAKTNGKVDFGVGCFLPVFAAVSKRSVFEVHSDGSLVLNFTWLTKPEWGEGWREQFGYSLHNAGFIPAEFSGREIALPASEWATRLADNAISRPLNSAGINPAL